MDARSHAIYGWLSSLLASQLLIVQFDGLLAEPDELADAMGESVDQLQELERAQLLSRGCSLDSPMGSDPDHGSLVDLLEDDRTSPMEQLEQTLRSEQLADLLSSAGSKSQSEIVGLTVVVIALAHANHIIYCFKSYEQFCNNLMD